MYRYATIHKGGLLQYSNADKNILFLEVSKDLKEKEIEYTDSDLMRAIERQSKMKIGSLAKFKPTSRPAGLKLSDAISGAKALVRYTLGKSATYEEVERRANICKNCPLKDSVSDCMACGGAARVTLFINKLKRDKKVQAAIPAEVRKHFCGMCGCSLPLLLVTHYEDFYTEDAQKNAARPDFCWMKRSSPNFTQQ